MKVVNVGYIPGEVIVDTLGLVRGSVVVKRNLKDFFLGIKDIFKEKVESDNEKYQEYIEDAMDDMVEHAKKLGADAVVNTYHEISSISKNKTIIMVYGTAVKFKK